MTERQLNRLNSWVVAFDPGHSHFASASCAVFLTWQEFTHLEREPALHDIFRPEYVVHLDVLDLRGVEKIHDKVKVCNCKWSHSSELVDRVRHAMQEFPTFFSANAALQSCKQKVSPFFAHWSDKLNVAAMSTRYICERQPIASCHVALTNLLQTEVVEKEAKYSKPLYLVAPQSIQKWLGTRGQEYQERKSQTVQMARRILSNEKMMMYPQLHASDVRVHDMADAFILILYYVQRILLPQYVKLWWFYRKRNSKRKRPH